MKKTIKALIILFAALIVSFFAVNTIRFIGINHDNIDRIQNEAYIPEEAKAEYYLQSRINIQWYRFFEYNQIYYNIVSDVGYSSWAARKVPLSFYITPIIVVTSGLALIELVIYLKHNKDKIRNWFKHQQFKSSKNRMHQLEQRITQLEQKK